MNAAKLPGNILPLLAILIAPNVRVLIDREDYKILTYLHWFCVALWVPLAFALVAPLLESPTTSKLKPFPAILLLVALALGIYANVTYLRRPVTRRR